MSGRTVSNPEGRAQPFSCRPRRAAVRSNGTGRVDRLYWTAGSHVRWEVRRRALRRRRIFALLEVFETDPGPLSLSELGRRAGLPVSTTHRLVAELHGWGALERADDGGYRLGQRVWRLGAATSWERRLRRRAPVSPTGSPPRSGTPSRFSMLAGDRLILPGHGRRPAPLDPAGHRRATRSRCSPPAPASCCCPRRRPGGWRSAGGRYSPLTERSLTSASVFAGQLAFAQRNGYAVAFGESCAGQSSVLGPDGPGGLRSDGVDHPDPDQHSDLTPLVEPLRRTALTIRGALAAPLPTSRKAGSRRGARPAHARGTARRGARRLRRTRCPCGSASSTRSTSATAPTRVRCSRAAGLRRRRRGGRDRPLPRHRAPRHAVGRSALRRTSSSPR